MLAHLDGDSLFFAECFGDFGVEVVAGEVVDAVSLEIGEDTVAVGPGVGVGGAGVVDVAVRAALIEQIVGGGFHSKRISADGHETSDHDGDK